MNKAKQGAMKVVFFQQESYQRTKNPPLLSPPRNNQKGQAEQSKQSSKMPSVLLSSNPCKKPFANLAIILKKPNKMPLKKPSVKLSKNNHICLLI
jgi:hypothetical protein